MGGRLVCAFGLSGAGALHGPGGGERGGEGPWQHQAVAAQYEHQHAQCGLAGGAAGARGRGRSSPWRAWRPGVANRTARVRAKPGPWRRTPPPPIPARRRVASSPTGGAAEVMERGRPRPAPGLRCHSPRPRSPTAGCPPSPYATLHFPHKAPGVQYVFVRASIAQPSDRSIASSSPSPPPCHCLCFPSAKMAVLETYDWIIALITIAFCGSAFGNGANDVANSYATSVAARTLTLPQVGVLAACTEFIGAVALGSRVTGTIKNNIIDLEHFEQQPSTLILTMGCAEFGSAFWLLTATSLGFPVSTTQTIVGALVGAGIASRADVSWEWKKGSVSQVAASWGIAPCIAAGFSAVLFGTIKYSVLNRADPFKWAMRLIPLYLAFTAGVLALFIVIEAPTADSLEDFGAGKATGIILGVFAAMLVVAYVFFLPYFYRRLVKEDTRVRVWHVPLGPLLWRENPPLYFPSHENYIVRDYYSSQSIAQAQGVGHVADNNGSESPDLIGKKDNGEVGVPADNGAAEKGPMGADQHRPGGASYKVEVIPPEPRERFLGPVKHLPLYHPKKIFGFIKYILLRGVTKDCVNFSNDNISKAHARAIVYDNKVEHLWTYAQVASAIMMSIAHGSNDVANAVGPWVAAYNTWLTGEINEDSDTPVWFLVVAGLLLGLGFWFFGYHIIRALGNRITRMSPTRGFSMELGAAITVLLASRLALPVSTTQCLTGATVGVALMNYDLGAVNWRQILKIFCGWVLTLPSAGLISGLLLGMALNTPHF
ncbi:phosphate transporter family-domain-containing protein [Lineolata rhizophorae]|uniref:Phosphate transporter n=1 Tax=Lineolata rhizophorae TaxID=578093 RepID=A0A6A6PA14_9PEZI|nr:phosphate transporter family-domain-containing protein [Lineolata rhizophorae]